MQKDTKHLTFIQDLDNDDQEVIAKAKQLAEDLHKVADDQRESARGAELLLLATIVHQYCVEDGETDTNVMEV